MKKEDVVWHEEDEYIVMEDADGWKLICVMNHFKGKFYYEIKRPDNCYLNYTNPDIYKTIEKLNQEKLNQEKENCYECCKNCANTKDYTEFDSFFCKKHCCWYRAEVYDCSDFIGKRNL